MTVSVPKSGELKHRVKLIRRIDKPTDTHYAYSDDEVLYECHAKIEPVGATYYFNMQTELRTTHRFWFRAVKGKTDCYSFNHGVLIICKNRLYRPVRVTPCNGEDFFTMVETVEVGENMPERNGSLMDDVLNG